MHARIFFLFLGSLLMANAVAQSWPGLFGPHRNGHVTHFQRPEQWPSKLQLAWELEVGAGYSAPIADQDAVFQLARMQDEEVVLKLDLASGKVLWRSVASVPFKMGDGGEWHGKGPKSTPVLADRTLHTFSIHGTLSSWDRKTGKLLWQHAHPAFEGKSHPFWGATQSPLVTSENTVIVRFGNDDEGILKCFDADTGRMRWSLGPDAPCYASPIIASLQGKEQLVEWNHEALIGVDLQTGAMLWRYPLPHRGSNQNMPTPVLDAAHQSILVGGENRGIQSIQPILQQGKWSTQVRWHQRRVSLDMSSAVLMGSSLYGLSHRDSGQLFGLQAKDGSVSWLGAPRQGEHAHFLALEEMLMVLSDRGQLSVYRPTAHGLETLASYEVSSNPTWAPPLFWQDRILIKDREKLLCWQLPSLR